MSSSLNKIGKEALRRLARELKVSFRVEDNAGSNITMSDIFDDIRDLECFDLYLWDWKYGLKHTYDVGYDYLVTEIILPEAGYSFSHSDIEIFWTKDFYRSREVLLKSESFSHLCIHDREKEELIVYRTHPNFLAELRKEEREYLTWDGLVCRSGRFILENGDHEERRVPRR